MNKASSRNSLLRPAAIAWILLDWAASAFSTILITLVVTYVVRVVFADGTWGITGGVAWAWIMATTMLLAAVSTPLLSARADRTHSHQRTLLTAVIIGSGSCFALAAISPNWHLAVVASIVVAGVAFDVSQIFAGSLLPRLAHDDAADRLSAAGFAAGYAGGAIALLVATAVVGAHESLGLSAVGGMRAAFAIMGGWWLLFSLPAAFIRIGDGRSADHAATSLGELAGFARSLARDPECRVLAGVLAGTVLVLGAVQTAISQFSSIAIESFSLDAPAVVRLVLMVQLVALPGALAVGWISTRWNRRVALGICVAGWTGVLVLACFVQTPSQLYGLAILLALVLGGVQSVTRATVAGFAPEGRYGATFGLLQVGSKLAGFTASVAFGGLSTILGNAQSGLVALVLQLIAGACVLRYSMPSTSRIE